LGLFLLLGGITMKKVLAVLLICVVCASFAGQRPLAQASPDYPSTAYLGPMMMDTAVQTSLRNLPPNDMLPVIITLRQQANLSLIHASDRAGRLQGVIQALQATANASQGRLTGLLNAYQAQGLVDHFTPLWVFNGFSVTATGAVIQALAQDPDVYAITSDDVQIVPAWGTPEANIDLVNAPALWNLGYMGQGVVVASMDSGVDATHPDLAARWRGGTNSWFDPYGQHISTPTDISGHGTWTTSVMVGGDAGGTSIGVAPGAQWIAVKIFNDQGGVTATAIHQGFQWLLDPDGNPSTADAPQVVNNSWTSANPGCDLEFEPDLEALRAAGILPVFAAGNGGPSNNTSYSPANNPAAFAVGAIDNTSQIYPYSSRGPSACSGATGPYPKIVAPGVNILTADLYGIYGTNTGTSLAAPHVAGGLALLLSAYPNLDAATQEQALLQTAVDLGASGPDDVFGYGRLDLLAALNWASTAPTPTPTVPPAPSPTPTATATAVPNVNLALNRPVTVSSFQDSAHDGPKAVDGNLGSQWQTLKVRGKNRSTSESITVDLGTSQDVTQVVLDWDVYFATSYTIQTSNNGSTWTTVFSTNSGQGGREIVPIIAAPARYIRLNSSGWNNSTYRLWLNELEVYQAAAAPGPTPTPSASSTPASPPPATATPTATAITATAVPTLTPGANNSIHVGDLDGATTSSSNRWQAAVTILVHDGIETPLEDVVVNGSWGSGISGESSCVTGLEGTCTINSGAIKNNVASASFSIISLSAGLSYQPTANHDPDNDSNGTTITVVKP